MLYESKYVKLYELMHDVCNLFIYFVCRMENRNVRDQEEEMKKEELVVVDECEEEEMTNEEWKVTDELKEDATSASAGIGLLHILL